MRGLLFQIISSTFPRKLRLKETNLLEYPLNTIFHINKINLKTERFRPFHKRINKNEQRELIKSNCKNSIRSRERKKCGKRRIKERSGNRGEQ